MLVPGVTKDSSLLIVVRIFQGLVEVSPKRRDKYAALWVQSYFLIDVGVLRSSQGVTYPASHGIWRHWAPPLERSRLATLALCGSYAGIVLGMPLSATLMSISYGTPFYFYGKPCAVRAGSHLTKRERAVPMYSCSFAGVMGLVWYACWNWLIFEKPSLHPTIEVRELTYIEKSLGQSKHVPVPTLKTTPWREFLHSMPVYAIIVANFCRSWNFYLLVMYQSIYFNKSLKLERATVSTEFWTPRPLPPLVAFPLIHVFACLFCRAVSWAPYRISS